MQKEIKESRNRNKCVSEKHETKRILYQDILNDKINRQKSLVNDHQITSSNHDFINTSNIILINIFCSSWNIIIITLLIWEKSI